MITAAVIELLFKRGWYRTLARIQRIRSGGVSPETSTTHPSPATKLPLEIIEIIINYLSYDAHTLRACTLTCYSWYIAAVPHLHHTLITTINSRDQKFRWPNPIRHMHTLGLLPLVKRFCVHRGIDNDSVGLSPKLVKCCVLRQLSALTNVQQLEIDYLDISNFTPKTRRYFGHFFPTVKSLFLREPKGSRRQIIYFIGMFQHLQDLALLYDETKFQEEPADDPTLVPLFVPPLRGVLRITHFTRVDLLKDMIELFDGIRFYYVFLYNMDGMRLLLDACVQTLKGLVLFPTDPRGEKPRSKGVRVPADNFTARTSPQDFDLSRNESLQTLEFPATDIDRALNNGLPDTASSFLKHVVSTIPSSARLRVVVSYYDSDFGGVRSYWPYLREMSQADICRSMCTKNNSIHTFSSTQITSHETRQSRRTFHISSHARADASCTYYGIKGAYVYDRLSRAEGYG